MNFSRPPLHDIMDDIMPEEVNVGKEGCLKIYEGKPLIS
jgi:hypothetical protein